MQRTESHLSRVETGPLGVDESPEHGQIVILDGLLARQQHPRGTVGDLRAVARRHGTDVTVIFDGSTVVGAHADRFRMVRVAYSPEGVTADDVIRDEVRRLPAARAVVVVTNDAEIIADVRQLGANTLPSNALLAAL